MRLSPLFPLFCSASLFLIVALAVAQPPGGLNTSKPLTVCEAQTNLQALRGTMVAVRGEINRTRSSFTVGGPDCGPPVETNGIAWPRALHLTEAAGAGEDGRGVTTDRAAEQKLLDELQKSGPGRVWATIVGRLVGRSTDRAMKLRGGKVSGNGFGPGAAYVAEMVIQTVQDIEVRAERRPPGTQESQVQP